MSDDNRSIAKRVIERFATAHAHALCFSEVQTLMQIIEEETESELGALQCQALEAAARISQLWERLILAKEEGRREQFEADCESACASCKYGTPRTLVQVGPGDFAHFHQSPKLARRVYCAASAIRVARAKTHAAPASEEPTE